MVYGLLHFTGLTSLDILIRSNLNGVTVACSFKRLPFMYEVESPLPAVRNNPRN